MGIKIFNSCRLSGNPNNPVVILRFACAQMKFHKHMRDMRDLLRFKAYFQFNVTF